MQLFSIVKLENIYLAKIIDPLLFSQHFGIESKVLAELGVFNPLLNVDAKLFIDPLLLKSSIHHEIKVGAVKSYNDYFRKIIKLLSVSKQENDVAWRNAEKFFKFHEVTGTCLGYSASSIHGSAWGSNLQQKTLRTAKEIINLGIDDPDLFTILALLEEGLGPDRISDMVTNIILEDLIKFNQRITKKLDLPLDNFDMGGINAQFLRNPLEHRPTPIILIPLDILRELPLANDWDEVCRAAQNNSTLREEVSREIGEIWRVKTRQDKEEFRNIVLANKQSCLSFLNLVKNTEIKAYDFMKDETGEIAWRQLLEKNMLQSEYPLKLVLNKNPSVSDLLNVVHQIIEQFTKLVEDKGIWKELWAGEKARPEKSAQRLFFAVADSYCKANNIDVTPEADAGNGPVDFKFSNGYIGRVLVEIKLSSSTKLVQGFEKQLQAYKAAEETTKAIYLVIDIGKMNNKDQKILDAKNKLCAEGTTVSEVLFVDGKKKLSASKL